MSTTARYAATAPHETPKHNSMSNSAWKMERDSQGIAWLTLDKPETSANTLSQQVMRELDALLQSLARSPPRGVIIRSGKPWTHSPR